MKLRSAMNWRHLVFGVLPMYGPLALMAALALGTWWLVKQTPLPQAQAQAPKLGHTPDYDMHGFAVRRFDASGALSSVVTGAVLRHYADNDQIEIDQIQVRAVDKNAHRLQARARLGLADSTASIWRLSGGAQVIRLALTDGGLSDIEQVGVLRPLSADDMMLSGEALQMNTKSHDVSSDLPVTLANARTWIRGANLRYVDAIKTATMSGQVHGQMLPKPTADAGSP